MPGFGASFGKRLLHRVAHIDPAAGRSGNRALDKNQTAIDIELDNAQIQRRHPLDAEMAGHFLVLERLARILTAAGRTMRTMRDRNAVGRPQAAEIPALHGAGEALAGARPGHVDELTDDEMIRRDLGADRQQRVFLDAKFGELQLRLDLRDRKPAALGLRHILDLGAADPELDGGIAVAILGPVRDDLTAVELQHGDRHMFASVGEDAGHAELLRDDT